MLALTDIDSYSAMTKCVYVWLSGLLNCVVVTHLNYQFAVGLGLDLVPLDLGGTQGHQA